MVFDGWCEVIDLFGCVWFVLKFKNIIFCINIGEFIGDFFFIDIGDVGDFEWINGYVFFNVIVGCWVV